MNADNKGSLVFKNTVNILHVDFSSNSLVSFNRRGIWIVQLCLWDEINVTVSQTIGKVFKNTMILNGNDFWITHQFKSRFIISFH